MLSLECAFLLWWFGLDQSLRFCSRKEIARSTPETRDVLGGTALGTGFVSMNGSLTL